MKELSRETLLQMIQKIIGYSRFLKPGIYQQAQECSHEDLEKLTIHLYQCLQAEIELMPEDQRAFETLVKTTEKGVLKLQETVHQLSQTK